MAVTDPIKEMIPSGFSLSGVSGMLLWLVLLVLFVSIVGVIIFLIIMKLKFNKKVVLFSKVDGRFIPTGKDKAMFINHGEAGDRILYLKKSKKYLPLPSIQTGMNTYWFFVGEDDEWINFGPGDFDNDRRKLGAHLLDKEMRYARTSLQHSFKERYDQPKFWEKYGGLLVNIGVIVIIMVFLWLIFDKIIEILSSIDNLMETAQAVMDQINQQLVALENIKNH